MKNPLRKRSSSQEIEAEITKLASKKVEYENTRASVLQSIEEAKTKRREILSGSPEEIEKSSTEIRRLNSEADDLAELINDYGAAIEDAQERFRDTQEIEGRETAAQQLQNVAKAIKAEAPAFEKAVAALAKSARAMMYAIPGDAGVYRSTYSSRPTGRPEYGARMSSRREAVSAVVAEALFSAMPEIFDTYRDDGYRTALFRMMKPSEETPTFNSRTHKCDALPPASAISVLLIDRLNDRARQIIAGEIEPSVKDIVPRQSEKNERLAETLKATEFNTEKDDVERMIG